MLPLFYWIPFVANALLSFSYKLNYHRCGSIGNIVHTQGLVLSSKDTGMSPLQLRGGDSKLSEVPAPSRTESRCRTPGIKTYYVQPTALLQGTGKNQTLL